MERFDAEREFIRWVVAINENFLIQLSFMHREWGLFSTKVGIGFAISAMFGNDYLPISSLGIACLWGVKAETERLGGLSIMLRRRRLTQYLEGTE